MAGFAAKLRSFISRVVLALGVAVLLLLIFLTQTSHGRERVLREVLTLLQGGVNGEILVGSVSSPGLLQGFTFRDVTIRGEDGRLFLVADSVRTGLSGPSLLRGDVVLRGVHLWGARITLERPQGQDRMNAAVIFRSGAENDSLPPPPDTVSGPEEGDPERNRRTIILRDATIHQGTLDVHLPLPPGRSDSGRMRVGRDPETGDLFRRLTFTELDLQLRQATLRASGQQGERFDVERLAFVGEVWPEPFRVTRAEGDIRREGNRLLASFRALELPNSRTRGQVDVRWGGEGGLRAEVRGIAQSMALQDLHFIEPRLPPGRASGPFGLVLGDAGTLLDFQDTELETDLGTMRATGGLHLGEGIDLRDLQLQLTDVDLALTDPWVMDTVPLRGRMSGDLRLTGDLDELEVEGAVDLTAPDSVSRMTVDVVGRMGFREGFSATSLHLTVAPLEWGALASVSPRMTLRGPGSARLVLTGFLAGDGLGIDGEFTHLPRRRARPASPGPAGQAAIAPAGGASRVTLGGRIRRDSTAVFLNLTSQLSPLSLTTLRRSFPNLPLEGEYVGTVNLRGPVSDLEVDAELETSGGPLAVTARFDARRPAEAWAVEAEVVNDFLLSNLLPSFPEPTLLRGIVTAQGRGFSLDALEGDANVSLHASEVGPIRVDSVGFQATVRDGVLHLQNLVAETEAGRLEGEGLFGVAPSAPAGEVTIRVESESLEPLRPLFMEEPTLIRDDLSPYQQSVLDAAGTDLDTLATAAEIAVGGSLQGTAVLRGGFENFTGEGALSFQNLRFRTDFVESGSLTFVAEDLPSPDARLRAEIQTDSVDIRSLAFQTGSAEVDLGKSGGRVRLNVSRSLSENHSARGTYALDSLGGGIVNLDELTLRFDSIRWNLGGPASFAWSPEGYRIRDFQLIRPGSGTMRLRADGFLPLTEGEDGDLRIDVERIDLSRLARVAQFETPLRGVVDFQGRMTGSPMAPVIEGSVTGENILFRQFSVGGLDSDLSYRDRRVDLTVRAFEGDRQVLWAEGYFPADLRIAADSARFPDGPMDLSVRADSFPAATALAFLETMEEVQGTLTGTLHFGGRSSDVEPRGELVLSGGSAIFTGLGVRHSGVEARFLLTPDGVVDVNGTLRSEGPATVSGTVTLVNPLSDPALNLTVQARNFLAVNRRDMVARLTGAIDVEGRYRRPLVSGDLTVEEGVMRVEEIARSVEVVDLSDPAFFDVVDTTLVTLQPIIQASQNPFLQNLRLSNMTLTMSQDSWLRGRDLNVEMAGNLDVYWDRTTRNLTFLGVLDAVRGVYSVFGRQFQVQGGTVSFPGTPGINPDLDIQAINRLRMSRTAQLEILAAVSGSLLEPRVSLTSNAPFPIAESDLVSYLIFGQPSYATPGGGGQAETGARMLEGAGASLAVGLFSRELGSILARDAGLDYLAVTRGRTDTPGTGTGRWNTVAATQVEIGQYLAEDIFAALYWRPFAGLEGQTAEKLAALRVEGRLSDRWTLEGYWEDRFFRNSIFLVGGLPGQRDIERVYGFLLLREWGY